MDRSEVTVQTQLPGRSHDTERAIASGYESLQRLDLDQIDIFLIHWPNPITGKFVDAWRGLVKLRDQGVVTESWSPRGKRNAPFAEGAVAHAANAHGVTPAQVVVRWQVQLGNVPLPKSSNLARQAANLGVFDFALSADAFAVRATSSGRPLP